MYRLLEKCPLACWLRKMTLLYYRTQEILVSVNVSRSNQSANILIGNGFHVNCTHPQSLKV